MTTPSGVLPTFQSPPPKATSTSSSVVVELGSETTDTGDVVVTAVTKTSIVNRLSAATIKDVVVSSEAIHLVRKSKNGPKTRLQKILDLETNAINIDVEMRPFASKIGVAYSRKLSKSDLADAIASKRIEYEANVASGADPDNLAIKHEDDKVSPGPKNKISVSKTRLANVVFSDKIRPLFDQRGQTLTAAELTDRKKTDQWLFEVIVEEYNSHKAEYAIDAFPTAVTLAPKAKPAYFSPNLDWKEALRVWKLYISQYEQDVTNFDVSGTHNDDDDNFAAFTQSSVIVYLHQYMKEYPGFLKKATGALNDDVQEESNGQRASKRLRATKRDSDIVERRRFNDSKDKQVQILKKSSAVKNLETLDEIIWKNKDRKRCLMDALAEAIPEKNERKQRKNRHMTRVEIRKGCGEDTEDDDTVESQAALFDDLVECNSNIGRAKAQKDSVNIEIEGST